MAQIEEIYKSRIAALMQAFYATKYVKEDKIPCQIEEGLFLGSLGAASNKDALKSLNITHILTVAISLGPAYPNDFIYKKIEVTDREDTDIAQYFNECFDFIDEAKKMGGAVLVHCFAGRSRSVTVVLAYLMKKHHLSLSQALEHVKSKRPNAAPNPGFMLQLQKFEHSLRASMYFHMLEVLEGRTFVRWQVPRPKSDKSRVRDLGAASPMKLEVRLADIYLFQTPHKAGALCTGIAVLGEEWNLRFLKIMKGRNQNKPINSAQRWGWNYED